MNDNVIISKQQLLNFLESIDIPYLSAKIKLDVRIDISVPGKRKLCDSPIEFNVHTDHVTLKILNKNLDPGFPVRFDSRKDILENNESCLHIEGYSNSGKCSLDIFPKNFH